MRLINANELKERILQERDRIPRTVPAAPYEFVKEKANLHGDAMRGGIRIALRCMEQTPAVDAVPVVRCGKCAKAKKFHNPQMGDLILCNEYRVFTDECGFCHKGAKMVGGDDGASD